MLFNVQVPKTRSKHAELEQDFTSSVTLHFSALRQSPSEPEANHFHLGRQLCSVSRGKLYGDMWPGFYRDASDLN